MAGGWRVFTKMTRKYKYLIFISFLLFCTVLLGVSVYMTEKSNDETQMILKQSINDHVLAAAKAAAEVVNPAVVEKYNSYGDAMADRNEYMQTWRKIVHLNETLHAKYTYVIKKLGDKYYFAYDADGMTNNYVFIEYEPEDVHLRAFAGESTADLEMQDEYGSFHTGAAPIIKDGKVVAIAAVDVNDDLYKQQKNSSCTNRMILYSLLIFTLIIMGIVLYIMLRNIKKMEDQLNHMAYYDKLTNLPNRQFLIEYLGKISGNKNLKFCLFFIDLDNFKMVNDVEGHEAGDKLLVHFGAFLDKNCTGARTFRPAAGVLNMAARLGGDEFVIVEPSITTEDQAKEYAELLLKEFVNSTIDDNIIEHQVTLSIGGALFGKHANDFNELLKCADIAMYYAKRAGKNRYASYDTSMKPE